MHILSVLTLNVIVFFTEFTKVLKLIHQLNVRMLTVIIITLVLHVISIRRLVI